MDDEKIKRILYSSYLAVGSIYFYLFINNIAKAISAFTSDLESTYESNVITYSIIRIISSLKNLYTEKFRQRSCGNPARKCMFAYWINKSVNN